MKKQQIIIKSSELKVGDKLKVAGTLLDFEYESMSMLHFKSKLTSIQLPSNTRFAKMKNHYIIYDFSENEDQE